MRNRAYSKACSRPYISDSLKKNGLSRTDSISLSSLIFMESTRVITVAIVFGTVVM